MRGFGFLHDGSVDTVFRFHRRERLQSFGRSRTRQNLEQFVLAFDTNLAPIVGQQVTLTSTNGAVAGPRIDLLIARAAADECDVVVKGDRSAVEQRGWVRRRAAQFRSDRASEALLTDAQLRALASAPGRSSPTPASRRAPAPRIGIDRDEDGYLDRDELDAGSDPAIR